MAGGWCDVAQVSLLYNTNEVTDYADDDKDDAADTGVIQACIDAAADDIWAIIRPALSTAAQASHEPGTYSAAGGVCRVLESKNATYAIDYLRERQGETLRNGQPILGDQNPHRIWAYQVADGTISIPGAQ